MRKVRLVVRNDRIRKDGTTPIKIEYYYDRGRRILLDTGKSIEPKYWDQSGGVVRKGHPSQLQLNEHVTTLRRRLEGILDDAIVKGVDPTPEYVKKKYEVNILFQKDQNEPGFFDYLDSFIASSYKRVSTDVIKDYRSLSKHLTTYAKVKKASLSFTSIDYNFYRSFHEYLTYEVEKPNGEKGLAINTVGKQIKNFKVFMRDCIRRGYCSYIDLSDYKTEQEEVDSIYLNDDEIQQLMDFDLNNSPSLARIRDLFVIGCETGLRFSDYSRLKPEHLSEKWIKIRTKKTNKNVVIPISSRLRETILKYDLEKGKTIIPSISQQKFNRGIKRIAEMAGMDEPVQQIRKIGGRTIEEFIPKFELISSHTCRRSFCTNQFLKGYPTLLIRQISGHKTETAFLRYIKISEIEAAKNLLSLWELPTH